MDIKESQDKILKAVKEARKLLQKENSISGDGLATGDNGVNPIGADAEKVDTLKTATAETKPLNTDQLGLARGKKGKLKEKKAEVKPGKAVIPLKSGEEVPDGYVQPKKGVRVAVKPEAISNPEQFIADKHKEENS
jgi:hypothetical protein